MTTRVAAPLRGVTRRWALSRAEWATTAVAAAVSSTAFIVGGQPYLARGVVGDVLGFALLGVGGAVAGGRVRHEAAFCLALIGAVIAADPQWPLRLGAAGWWGVFGLALAGYLAARRRLCS